MCLPSPRALSGRLLTDEGDGAARSGRSASVTSKYDWPVHGGQDAGDGDGEAEVVRLDVSPGVVGFASTVTPSPAP
jgi:hypothetical protein